MMITSFKFSFIIIHLSRIFVSIIFVWWIIRRNWINFITGIWIIFSIIFLILIVMKNSTIVTELRLFLNGFIIIMIIRSFSTLIFCSVHLSDLQFLSSMAIKIINFFIGFFLAFLCASLNSVNSIQMASQPEPEHPRKAFGWAARDTSGVLSPFNFSRRETGEKDVTFKVLYCGICHSDLHMIKNGWGNSIYPLVPGHEIVGEVTEAGSRVEKFKVGDKVGVGCMVGSCRSYQSCAENLENYCPKMILTYGAKYVDGTITYGGYSDLMVADEHFVVLIPDGLPLDAAAPLLCAGISVYSPLRHVGLDKTGLHLG